MKICRLLVLGLAIAILALPVAGIAEMHDHATMDHSNMEHSGMDMAGDKIPLGETAAEGVVARGMLKDIHEAMAKMGMEMTHHFMVFFTVEDTGAPVGSGIAAVKVTDPSGNPGTPAKLMGMGQGFGADIVLKEKGEYLFTVGTKLEDGQKRQFSFSYIVK